MELELAEVEQHPAVAAFVAELRRWREVNGCSQKKLAAAVNYDPSYVSKVERGSLLASKEFAEAADQHLHAGRAIIRRWKEMHEALVELSEGKASRVGRRIWSRRLRLSWSWSMSRPS